MQPQSDESGNPQSAPAPGAQFTPDGGTQAPPEPVQPAPVPAMPAPTPVPQPPVDTPPPPAALFAQTDQAAPVQQRQSNVVPGESVSWSASEFMAHQKGASWYGLLALAGIAAAGVVFALTRDVISTVMVLIVMLALGIFAARKPRTLDYQVDTSGIHIGPKSYPYEDFKSFSVIDEGAMSSINLVPMKRFMPAISVYYDPQDEDHIVDVLSAYLPFEEGKKDAVDRFMHRIRF